MKVVIPVHGLIRLRCAVPRHVQLSAILKFSPVSRNMPVVMRVAVRAAAVGAPWTRSGVKRVVLGRLCRRSTSSAPSIHSSSGAFRVERVADALDVTNNVMCSEVLRKEVRGVTGAVDLLRCQVPPADSVLDP